MEAIMDLLVAAGAFSLATLVVWAGLLAVQELRAAFRSKRTPDPQAAPDRLAGIFDTVY